MKKFFQRVRGWFSFGHGSHKKKSRSSRFIDGLLDILDFD